VKLLREIILDRRRVSIGRDSRLAVARLVRELDLGTEPPVPECIAPPSLLSNNRGHRARKAARS